MTVPIIPAAPVNNVITIQPVTTTIPNREQGGSNPLSTLPQGTTVQGFVVNRDAQANPILRTPLGDLRITSDVFLKTGSEVIFRVDNSQSSLARIVTVDGLSPQDYSTSSARGLTRDTITPSGLQTSINNNPIAQAANAAAGNANSAPVLQAIVLQGAAVPQAPSLLANALASAQSGPLPIVAQLAQLRAGTPLKLTLLDLKLPPIPIPLGSLPESNNLTSLLTPRPTSATATPPQNPTAGAPATTPATLPPQSSLTPLPTTATAPQSAPISTPQAASPATALVPPNAPLTASTASTAPAQGAILPQSAAETLQANATSTPLSASKPPATNTPKANTQPPTPELAKPTAPNQLVATVIGHDADGANILQTPFASLKIYTPQPLPTGTTLLVRADFVGTTTSLNAAAAQGNAPVALTPATPAQSLAPFGETIAWLQSNHPDVAQDALIRVPNLSQHLANGLLNYLIGIRSGDVGDIIGKRALRLLEISNPELLSRLRQQVDQLQGNFIDSPSSQWNALPIPLFLGSEVNAAKLFIHKEPPEESKAGATSGHGQRFILEVEMSQLGPLQFDGFVRSQERGKNFDLMVRSNEPLPVEISSGIREIFTNTMEATRIHGQVIFQAGQQYFVSPSAPTSPFSGSGVNTILA